MGQALIRHSVTSALRSNTIDSAAFIFKTHHIPNCVFSPYVCVFTHRPQHPLETLSLLPQAEVLTLELFMSLKHTLIWRYRLSDSVRAHVSVCSSTPAAEDIGYLSFVKGWSALQDTPFKFVATENKHRTTSLHSMNYV